MSFLHVGNNYCPPHADGESKITLQKNLGHSIGLSKTKKWEFEEQRNERVFKDVRREIAGEEMLTLISKTCQIKSHCILGLQESLDPHVSGPTHKC